MSKVFYRSPVKTYPVISHGRGVFLWDTANLYPRAGISCHLGRAGAAVARSPDRAWRLPGPSGHRQRPEWAEFWEPENPVAVRDGSPRGGCYEGFGGTWSHQASNCNCR